MVKIYLYQNFLSVIKKKALIDQIVKNVILILWKKRYQEKRQTIEEYKASLACEKCGDTRGYVLDFHHLDPAQKDNTVARLLAGTYSLDTVYKEIDKCVVLCANCHREFHYLEKQKQKQKENFSFKDFLEENIIE